MKWIDFYFPNQVFIVEVKYSGDISISHARCKDFPPRKNNSRGFTENFLTYESAKEYAEHMAKELNFPF